MLAPYWPKIVLDNVYGLDVSHDGSVVIGSSQKVLIARDTATGAVLWRKVMAGCVWPLRIHEDVVVAPVHGSQTVVLDVTTGQQVYTLPSAGFNVVGVCVFEGLTIGYIRFVHSHRDCFSAANKIGIKGG